MSVLSRAKAEQIGDGLIDELLEKVVDEFAKKVHDFAWELFDLEKARGRFKISILGITLKDLSGLVEDILVKLVGLR